jgi:hypothetical protein
VPVDRHWVAAEGLPEPAHGQRVNAVGVDDRYGGGEDLLAGQRGAPACGVPEVGLSL